MPPPRRSDDGSLNRTVSEWRQLISICADSGPYCLVGGVALHAYLEPEDAAEVDLVVPHDRLVMIQAQFKAEGFQVEAFPYPTRAILPGRRWRIHLIQDIRYRYFLSRAGDKIILGASVRVASLDDIIQATIWNWSNSERRLSQRMQDQADLLRIGQKYPEMIHKLPHHLAQLLTGADPSDLPRNYGF